MNPQHDTGGESRRMAQFQLQGNAAERYERWVVPFVSHPMVLPLLDLTGLRPGERVLDLATGTGVLARLAARRVVPGGAVTGLDLNDEMLKVARELPLPPGLKIEWRQGSAQALPFDDGVFDAVTISFGLRNVVDHAAGLREMARVTRPGGRLVVCEFSTPTNGLFATVYKEYLMQALPRIAGAVSSNPEAYVYLAESIRAWPDQAELARQIADAGWSAVRWRNLTGGIVALHAATKP
jgi:demethylmenaquinone methyltransferase/2-methoxy-6-polyprenyl-1,4-benzoquinol methylase